MLGLIKRALLSRSYDQQRRGGPRDPRLWDLEVNARGHLAVGGLDALDLLQTYGSPLLVVHQANLMRHAREMIEAMAPAPAGSGVFYSYKTNCIPGILNELHAIGIGAEVISPFELWLAQRLGVPGERVIYNGVDKTDESLDLAVGMGLAAINIDHPSEIDRIVRVAERRGARAQVGVRLALVEKSQFGLDVPGGEAMDACRRILARPDALDLRCIHFNITSNARRSADHMGALKQALEFIGALKAATGHAVPMLDIGGGFGVPTTRNLDNVEYLLYRGLGIVPVRPDPSDCQPIGEYVGDLVREVRRACDSFGIAPPAVVVEPGRFITSRSETLLTKINSVKSRGDGVPFAMTDAGRLSVTFPCEFEYHEVLLPNRPSAPVESPYMVMGRVCTSADWLLRNRLLPALRPDDVLAVMDAGAYFSSYSSNFAFPRPAIVMVKDGQASVIRSAESFEHLTAMDRVPQLRG